MKKFGYLILIFVAVSLLGGAQFAGASTEVGSNMAAPKQGQDPVHIDWLDESGKFSTEPNQEQDPIPADWPDEPGIMPELVGGKKTDLPLVLIEKSGASAPQAVTETTIDVWYGNPQSFGQKGNPQEWVNITGNVSSPIGIKSLSYTLNGSPEQPLSIGPDNPRLVNNGDFNAEIGWADADQNLIAGANTVIIKATDSNDAVTTKNVVVNYTAKKTWPESYDANWASSTDIQNIAQPVDGKWALQGGKLVMAAENAGYDRLITMGDVGNPATKVWTDYEVTVPVTVRGIDLSDEEHDPGVGIVMRWQGHTPDNGEQPRTDWSRTGAIGWYRWKQDGSVGLEQRGYDWRRGPSTAKEWEFDTTYILKMSVQSAPTPGDTRAYYRLKFWKQGQAEPGAWDLAGYSSSGNSPSGSVQLIAHFAHVEFGDVKIRPLDELSFTLTTNAVGDGIVNVDPINVTEFAYAQRVSISAFPAPDNYLESWSGDLSVSGVVNPLNFSMTKDMVINANFKAANPGTLTVNVTGEGEVSKSPDKETYDGGEKVTLTAVPKTGNIFKGWGGDLSGTLNPTSIIIDGNQTVVAEFVGAGEASPVSDDFNRCELSTDLWQFVNPSGNGLVSTTGSTLQLTSPAGERYTMWSENRDAPRIMQDTEDQDFSVAIKFDSIPQGQDQTLGFLVQQDAQNWLRFDIHNSGSTLKMFAGATINGSSTSKWNEAFSAGGSSEIYMRVSRIGDSWTQAYSRNGVTWESPQNPVSFTQALNVSSTGIFAGNSDPGAPTFVLTADYFKNAAYPVGVTGYLLDYNVIGQGDVVLSPEPDMNGRYGCNQQVSVQALPADTFSGWSGDLSGQQNPAILTMNSDKSVTASFATETKIFLPGIFRK